MKPARVALCSLPVIGEDPDSEVNRRIRKYSKIIKQIAREENVNYISFYKRCTSKSLHLLAAPSQPISYSISYPSLEQLLKSSYSI
jgi:hypothetical protein